MPGLIRPVGNWMKRRSDTTRDTVTILDVARVAGVATSTVSRALTQPGRVSETMRKHVMNIAVELGYRPNLQARSLSSGKTHSLALLIPGATNPYFFDLIRGTQIEAKVRGYRHMLVERSSRWPTVPSILSAKRSISNCFSVWPSEIAGR